MAIVFSKGLGVLGCSFGVGHVYCRGREDVGSGIAKISAVGTFTPSTSTPENSGTHAAGTHADFPLSSNCFFDPQRPTDIRLTFAAQTSLFWWLRSYLLVGDLYSKVFLLMDELPMVGYGWLVKSKFNAVAEPPRLKSHLLAYSWLVYTLDSAYFDG